MSSSREESTSELAETERAGTALREKVLEEFRTRRDSSALNFYKLMTFFPERLRVMWLCKASPSYRSKAEFDENDLYATRVLRRELDEDLKLFCQELPALMQRFIGNLSRMRHEIDWIEREAERIWPLFKNEYQIWAQIACDGQAADQDWRAPGWLDKWPTELPPDEVLSAARGDRIDTIRTAEVLKLFVERIKTPMEQAQIGALNNLRILFAQEREDIVQLERKRAREAAAQTPSKDEAQDILDISEDSRDILKDGERCDNIIKQIKKIRNIVRGHGYSMTELRFKSCGLEVWSLVDGLSDDEREVFNHPNRWGAAVGYAKRLLAKDYGVAVATIGNWVKAYRRENPSARVKRTTAKKTRTQKSA